jgi:predicted secreted protein
LPLWLILWWEGLNLARFLATLRRRRSGIEEYAEQRGIVLGTEPAKPARPFHLRLVIDNTQRLEDPDQP